MRKMGDKKVGRSKVPGHQNCAICLPDIKNGRAKGRRYNGEIEAGLEELSSDIYYRKTEAADACSRGEGCETCRVSK